ncbi:MAG TPA: LacI family DNA-binding transcriptional regulator [Halanaerobiales bacterium]|nr:LacI family DNA-binding transcriptional regulator [Halanaerobiales bacterium]
MKIRLKDIANAANVSVATVSLALNNKKGVSKQKKQEILDIARQMGYDFQQGSENQANAIRFIIYKRHGYVVSDTPFFSNLIEGIQRECRENNYEMLISHITKNEENYLEIIDDIKNDNCSGTIILATEMYEEDLQQFLGINKPVLLLDSYIKHQDYDFVLINNTSASYKASSYLINKNHKEIGYLHSSVYINNFYYREQGFRGALKDHDIEYKSEYIFELEPTLEGSYQDMINLLNNGNKKLPTAFFADNDIIAFGALRAMKEKGIKIPDEVSIIGFDDMPYCQISRPRLSTIRVFKQDIGRLAVKRLLEKIDKKDEIIQKTEVATELIERESVKKLAK